jgi:hypothetical protein
MINDYILGFSLFIFLMGFATFALMSLEFKKMSDHTYSGKDEGGPRAKLFNALYDYLSDEDDLASDIRNAKKSEIKELVEEWNEKRTED